MPPPGLVEMLQPPGRVVMLPSETLPDRHRDRSLPRFRELPDPLPDPRPDPLEPDRSTEPISAVVTPTTLETV